MEEIGKKIIVSSFLWKASEHLLLQGLGLVVQIILARLLMPEDFACLAIINAIVVYLGLFVQSGLSTVVIQRESLDDLDISTLFTTSFIIAFIIYVPLFFVAPYISNYYNYENLTWPIRVMSLTLFLYSFNSVQSGLLIRRMKFKTIFVRNVLSLPIAATIGIFMAYNGYGVWALIAFHMLSTIITIVFMCFIPELRLKIGFSITRAKEMYSFSSLILLTNLISSGSDSLRTMVIGKKYTPNNLAYYDRAYTYSNLLTGVVSVSLSSVMFPVFSRQQNDISKIYETARRTVGLSSYVIFPFMILIAIMAKPLVLVILTEKWIPCAVYLSIFALFRILGVVTSIDKQIFYALGNSKIGLYYELFLLFANVLMLYIAVPLGLIYVAIGAFIVELVGNFLLMMISSKLYGYKLVERIRDMAKPIANSIIMSVFIYIISCWGLDVYLQILLQLTIGVASYLLLSYITKDQNLALSIKTIREFLNKNTLDTNNKIV